jgi:hypothetical protein
MQPAPPLVSSSGHLLLDSGGRGRRQERPCLHAKGSDKQVRTRGTLDG